MNLAITGKISLGFRMGVWKEETFSPAPLLPRCLQKAVWVDYFVSIDGIPGCVLELCVLLEERTGIYLAAEETRVL